jgi:hypothetical protein
MHLSRRGSNSVVWTGIARAGGHETAFYAHGKVLKFYNRNQAKK